MGGGGGLDPTCVVDGVRPQQMCHVVGPRHLALPVLRLQRDAVSGSSGVADPHLELHPLLAHVLGQTHLARLRAGREKTFEVRRNGMSGKGKGGGCYLDALFVAVDAASRAGTLQFGEDQDVLVEEDVPHPRPFPPRTTTYGQLTLPHQVPPLCHGNLRQPREAYEVKTLISRLEHFTVTLSITTKSFYVVESR